MELDKRQKSAVLALVAVGAFISGATILLRSQGSVGEVSPTITITDPSVAGSNGSLLPGTSASDNTDVTGLLNGLNASDSASAAEAPASEVVVHVAGKVKNPGVYHLKPGARVVDAVNAAGGSKQDADLDLINLAARVRDSDQIFIPAKGEQAPVTAAVEQARSAYVAPHAKAAPASSAAGSSTGGTSSASSSPKAIGKININTAGPDELDRLPGVGPATAAKIIEYRKASGGFNSPEELMNVKGIAEKKFADMQPYVVVR